VIFLDEKGAICAKEYGGRSWREKRKRMELGQKINGMRNLFGGLDVIEGREVIESYERRRSGEFCDFLRKLKERYFGYGLWLVMDNVPVHKSKMSLAMMEELGIHQFWLPKASPELNPQELVWKLMQNRYINNRDFRDVDEIEEMVADFENDFNQRRMRLDLSRYNGQLGS
jgi:transposase